MEVTVVKDFVNPQDTKPYTVEDKLREMGKKNPTLLELQKDSIERLADLRILTNYWFHDETARKVH